MRIMSVLDVIERARQKPRGYRKRIFTAALVVMMGSVVAFWLSTLRAEMFRPSPDTKGPVAVLRAPFAALYGQIKTLLQRNSTTVIYDTREYEDQR